MKTKRILAALLAIVMIVSVGACMTGCSSDDGKYTIGVCQLVAHEALDAATQGFIDTVTAEFGKENVEVIVKKGAGDGTDMNAIINDFVTKKVDLILANATAALQAAANSTEEIPILGTSITEYGVALDIDDFNGTVGGNVSGTSDLAPLDKQADMVLEIVPNAKKVGMLYCSAEPNSAYQVKVVTDLLKSKGLEVKNFSFTASSDVALVAAAAAAECDVIYIPTDNTAASCTETINNAVLPTKTPVIAGEAGICKGCGAATLSISYYDLGVTTGKMAIDILKGDKDISEMPIQYAGSSEKMYNKANCDALGITVSADYTALD